LIVGFLRNTDALAHVDVYIDDFIALAQRATAQQTARSLFHALDTIFADTDDTARRPVVSTSKLDKGDAAWSHTKRILGWDIDAEHMTLLLPTHRHERLHHLLSHFLLLKCTSRRQWQRLLGELRSMAPALHSTKYLFSVLQHVLVDQASGRVRLNASSSKPYMIGFTLLMNWQHTQFLSSIWSQPPRHSLAPLMPLAMAWEGAGSTPLNILQCLQHFGARLSLNPFRTPLLRQPIPMGPFPTVTWN
jgi:hypothetical protein